MDRLSLPMMRCDEGCSDCCGPVLCKPAEFRAVAAYAEEHGIAPMRHGITCPWFQEGKCQVYPVRPWVCQMFGHSSKLVCSRGYNRNVSRPREKKMAKGYGLDKETAMLLHEVFDDFAEVLKEPARA